VVRQLLQATLIAAIISGIAVSRTYGIAGNLNKPGIAIPSDGGTPDRVVAAMYAMLLKHEKQFVGGHYINADSVLHFAGGTKAINSLLAELSKIDGAVLHVRFSKGAESVDLVSETGAGLPEPYDFAIEHNAWADGRSLSITICLGENVRVEDLSLPAICGHSAP
jgi:hypothetical protein